jgi:hypothetical protein
VEQAISQTAFKDVLGALSFQEHEWDGWPIKWSYTAKEAHYNFPAVILRELPDGKVTGVLMREARAGHLHEKFASKYAEPEEVEEVLARLAAMPVDARFMLRWHKEGDVIADSLDAAMKATPQSPQGQKYALVYRDNEWWFGIWNDPNKDSPLAGSFILTSLADFHGLRTSKAKRDSRGGLDIVREKQTLAGNYALLDEAIAMLPDIDRKDKKYEEHPALKLLVNWWNEHAPSEEMRHAGYCRFYVWNEKDRTFIAGDPEEPAVQASAMASTPTFALFEREGSPAVALCFYRGRAFNTEKNGGTLIYWANGEEMWDLGLDISEVDEAYYAIAGLRALPGMLVKFGRRY